MSKRGYRLLPLQIHEWTTKTVTTSWFMAGLKVGKPRSMIRVEGYCHGVKKFITFFLKIQFLQMMSYMRPRILPKKNMYHLWVKKNLGGAFGGSECWKMLKNGIFSFPTKIEWLKEVPKFPFISKMSTSCVYFIHNWPTYNGLI